MRNLDKMSNEECIEQARTNFDLLKRAFGNPPLFCEEINQCLDKAGVDYAALDPEGKKSAVTMKQELDAACAYANLQHAKSYYERLCREGLKAYYSNQEFDVREINECLEGAGRTAKALDPDGEATDEGMLAAIEKARVASHIAEARHGLVALKTDLEQNAEGTRIAYDLSRVANHSHFAGIEVGSLAQDGDLENPQATIDRAMQKIESLESRHRLTALLKSGSGFARSV